MLKKHVTPNAGSAENMQFGGYFIEQILIKICSHPIISWFFCDPPISHEKILWPPQLFHDPPIRKKMIAPNILAPYNSLVLNLDFSLHDLKNLPHHKLDNQQTSLYVFKRQVVSFGGAAPMRLQPRAPVEVCLPSPQLGRGSKFSKTTLWKSLPNIFNMNIPIWTIHQRKTVDCNGTIQHIFLQNMN